MFSILETGKVAKSQFFLLVNLVSRSPQANFYDLAVERFDLVLLLKLREVRIFLKILRTTKIRGSFFTRRVVCIKETLLQSLLSELCIIFIWFWCIQFPYSGFYLCLITWGLQKLLDCHCGFRLVLHKVSIVSTESLDKVC